MSFKIAASKLIRAPKTRSAYHRPAPVPAAKHMIDCPRILDAQRSSHRAKECTQSKCVSVLGSDPFWPFSDPFWPFWPFWLLAPLAPPFLASFPRFLIESRQSKTPKILAGNILRCFSDLLQRVASINAIPQTRMICVVAYLQAADWIDRLVS